MTNIMYKIDATEFETLEDGTRYMLPEYTVTDQGLKKTGGYPPITFVRGSVKSEDDVIKTDGILHEGLLAMQIHDLKLKNKLVPSRETALAITKLEEALHWIQARQNRRKKEGTAGSYKK